MADSNRLIISGLQILENQHWVSEQALIVEDGVITGLIAKEMIQHHLPAQHLEFPANYFLTPGLIDLHIHGAAGSDVMDGTPKALHTISQNLATEGVTGFLATTMTSDNQHMETVLKTIAAAMQEQNGAAILGVHLEGPFIAKEKMGAQRGDAVALPDAKLVQHWQTVAAGAIKLVTLAPELPDALDLIRLLRSLDIVVSVGHTNATHAETIEAIAAGCTHATHLFNAMRGMHQREPGASGALLLSPSVFAELIVDGVHLHPAMVDLALCMKTKDRLLLVTDAMRAKCMADGEYDLGGQVVTVRSQQATLSDGTLAGSTLRMPQAIKNMVKFTRCSLADAISMAAFNPARVLNLEMRKGSIEVGKDADLVVMNAELEVVLTLRAGKQIYRAEHKP